MKQKPLDERIEELMREKLKSKIHSSPLISPKESSLNLNKISAYVLGVSILIGSSFFTYKVLTNKETVEKTEVIEEDKSKAIFVDNIPRVIEEDQQESSLEGIVTASSLSELKTYLSEDNVETVYLESGTYYVTDTIEVPKNKELILKGGSLNFTPLSGINVMGSLKDESKVTFTSIEDYWRNITVLGGELHLQHSLLENGTGSKFSYYSATYNSTISETGRYNSGGLIAAHDSKLTLGSNVIIRNGKAEFGGGIMVYQGEASIAADITENTAIEGGGMYLLSCDFDFSGFIHHNKALYNGGGVNIVTCDGSLKSGLIKNNTVTNLAKSKDVIGLGGGAFINGLERITLDKSKIKNNSPDDVGQPRSIVIITDSEKYSNSVLENNSESESVSVVNNSPDTKVFNLNPPSNALERALSSDLKIDATNLKTLKYTTYPQDSGISDSKYLGLSSLTKGFVKSLLNSYVAVKQNCTYVSNNPSANYQYDKKLTTNENYINAIEAMVNFLPHLKYHYESNNFKGYTHEEIEAHSKELSVPVSILNELTSFDEHFENDSLDSKSRDY